MRVDVSTVYGLQINFELTASIPTFNTFLEAYGWRRSVIIRLGDVSQQPSPPPQKKVVFTAVISFLGQTVLELKFSTVIVFTKVH